MTVTGTRGDGAVERMIGRMILEAHKDEYQMGGEPKTIEIQTNDDDSYTVTRKERRESPERQAIGMEEL